MKRISIVIFPVIWALLAGSAYAQQQFTLHGGSQLNPLLPAPPPPPKIEVPPIPQMDVPSQPSLSAAPRASFGDRISQCLDEGAAAGLNPSARAAYSRACANQD